MKSIEDYTHLTANQTMTECGETATLPEIVHVTLLSMVDCPDCLASAGLGICADCDRPIQLDEIDALFGTIRRWQPVAGGKPDCPKRRHHYCRPEAEVASR